MCYCKRYQLDQLDVPYTYSFVFYDCKCSPKQKFFALECKQNCCPYNLAGFAGNYFFSICCSCPDIDKDQICVHCRRLTYSLNNDTIKVCLKKENLPREFKLIKLDNYLRKNINADPHFFFCKEDNEIKATLDSPDCINFFKEKRLCKYNFSVLVISLSVLIRSLSIYIVKIIFYC